jgi:hypothetical protein
LIPKLLANSDRGIIPPYEVPKFLKYMPIVKKPDLYVGQFLA